jgi:predicted house-cleaning noncanonical NTP pyrophosphatase (MazG superfamily)
MSDKKIDDDYEFSREVYYDLIEKGRDGIEEMLELAKQSEHPRAFEVLSQMIKNVSDVSDRLMALNTAKKKLETIGQPALENKGTTNNNIFIGSTTELQRFLHNEKQIIEHDDSD